MHHRQRTAAHIRHSGALPVNRVRATHICPKLQTPLTSFPARGRQPTLPTSRPQPSLALLLPKPRSSPCRGAGGQQDPLASSITAGGPPEHQHPATTPRSASPRASWSTQQQTRDFLLLYSQLTASLALGQHAAHGTPNRVGPLPLAPKAARNPPSARHLLLCALPRFLPL